VLPSVRRSAGSALSAAEIMASTVRPASPLTAKLPSAIARRTAPAGVCAALFKRQGRVVTGEQVAKALLEAVLTAKTGTHIIESENLRNV
jgi:hypothetical protein